MRFHCSSSSSPCDSIATDQCSDHRPVPTEDIPAGRRPWADKNGAGETNAAAHACRRRPLALFCQ